MEKMVWLGEPTRSGWVGTLRPFKPLSFPRDVQSGKTRTPYLRRAEQDGLHWKNPAQGFHLFGLELISLLSQANRQYEPRHGQRPVSTAQNQPPRSIQTVPPQQGHILVECEDHLINAYRDLNDLSVRQERKIDITL